MILFFLGLGILILGYFTYGKLVEKILTPTDLETPAIRLNDGVDFVVMPQWKDMLIQLLNIAGVGPVIGVILGIKFGAIVFIILPIGNVIGGAVHDYIGGMMSLRSDGANLPAIVKDHLGSIYYRFFITFISIVLLLVVAVFINVPAGLIESLKIFKNCDGELVFWAAVILIFLYYIIATMFPVDKIIGKIYPFFGALLIVSTLAIFVVMVCRSIGDTTLLSESAIFKTNATMTSQPIIPVLFVTIACGIISGFHATQSPIIARTMRSEHEARANFYGMMILEGIIGMTWAGAALVIYNKIPTLLSDGAGVKTLTAITNDFLGPYGSSLAILGVIVLAISSGDTAMRSLRLSIAESLNYSQKPLLNRFLICLPLIVLVSALLIWSNNDKANFSILWKYFAWANQILAVTTLLASMVYLIRNNKPFWIALIPGGFMTFIVCCYILWTGPDKGGPIGLNLNLNIAYIISSILTIIVLIATYFQGKRKKSLDNEEI